MGTYILRASAVSSAGWTPSGGTALQAINNVAGHLTQDTVSNGECPPATPTYFGPLPGTYQLIATPGTDFYLDGSGTPTDVNSLPAGFLSTGSTLRLGFQASGSSIAACCASAFAMYGGLHVDTIKPYIDGSNHQFPVFYVPFGVSNGNILTNVITNQWGMEITWQAGFTTNLGCGNFTWAAVDIVTNGMVLVGDYTIVSSHWTLSNLTHPALTGGQALTGRYNEDYFG
jgi:hypothetical protein